MGQAVALAMPDDENLSDFDLRLIANALETKIRYNINHNEKGTYGFELMMKDYEDILAKINGKIKNPAYKQEYFSMWVGKRDV